MKKKVKPKNLDTVERERERERELQFSEINVGGHSLDDPENNKIKNVGAGLVSAHGITLITLVITIILLLILAGVAINLSLGDNGLLTTAKKAKEEYLNAQTTEEEGLNNLYSEMLVATGDDSKITVSVEDLRSLIQEEIKNSQPTGVKTDTYICNRITDKSATSGVTSMNGLTRTTDADKNIEEYLSYSGTDGYTVLKSGWYFFDIEVNVNTSNVTRCDLYLIYNGKSITRVISQDTANNRSFNDSSFSIYLKKDDKFYFNGTVSNTAVDYDMYAYCYPMF